MHGQFIWYELTTPDVDAAQRFYPRFTGWGTQPFDKDYTMWTNGGTPFAGIYRLSDEMRQQGIPPSWMPHVETSNVDETAAKAQSLGGQVVHPPSDIPNVGRYAVLQDPQGAVFGIYQPNTPGGAWDGTPVVGRPSWHELMTTDYKQALAFYRALFGWEQTSEMDMGGGQMYSLFGTGQTMYGGMFNRHGDMESMQPFWLVYINVKDVGKAVAAATKAGATVHRPQMDIPGGSIAILADPQGAGFAVHHVSAPAAASKPAAKKSAPRKAGAPKSKKRASVAKRPKSTAGSKATSKSASKSKTRSAGTKARTRTATSKPKRKAAARTRATAAPRGQSKAKTKARARAKKR